MADNMGPITGVFAMRKGTRESTAITGNNTSTASDYSGNMMEKAFYKTPLNPLLTRGEISEAFSNFTIAIPSAGTINSYEIHKADSDNLRNTFTGINQSNSNSSCNRGWYSTGVHKR